MLNYLWAIMIIIGVVYGAITGNMEIVGNAAIDPGKEAVSLCITMLGVVSMWTGVMKIAENCGIIEGAAKKTEPFIRFMFPRLPKEHKAKEYITTNIIANIFGLGWAATPGGLKAMKELSSINNQDKRASDEMCTFLVLNISSLQLIPVNIIAYRSQYGSVKPAVIVGPAIVATLISTLAGIIFCKIMTKKKNQVSKIHHIENTK